MSESKQPAQRWWETTWPFERADWARLLGAFVVVVGVGVVVGEVLTNWSGAAGVVRFDERSAGRFEESRTDVATDVWHWVALMSGTIAKIVLSIVVAVVLVWRFRRWAEAAMATLPLIFEASAFIVTTSIVGRPRPAVERLLTSPVDTSFPSGHVAAAVTYAALAIIVFWHTRNVWARAFAVTASIVVALAVAWARMYQGMHFVSDVVGGLVLGVVSVSIGRWIVGRPTDAIGVRAVDE